MRWFFFILMLGILWTLVGCGGGTEPPTPAVVLDMPATALAGDTISGALVYQNFPASAQGVTYSFYMEPAAGTDTGLWVYPYDITWSCDVNEPVMVRIPPTWAGDIHISVKVEDQMTGKLYDSPFSTTTVTRP